MPWRHLHFKGQRSSCKMATQRGIHSGQVPEWTLREQLILASAVQRSGDQNWVSVSRAVKPLAEDARPPDYFSQKNCALQYSAMLDKASTPKRKRTADGTPEVVETVEEQIVRQLTEKRINQLNESLADTKEEYLALKRETEQLERGELEDRLPQLWEEVQAELAAKEEAEAKTKDVPSLKLKNPQPSNLAKYQEQLKQRRQSQSSAHSQEGATKAVETERPRSATEQGRAGVRGVEETTKQVQKISVGEQQTPQPGTRGAEIKIQGSVKKELPSPGLADEGWGGVFEEMPLPKPIITPKEERFGVPIRASQPSVEQQLVSEVHIIIQQPNTAVVVPVTETPAMTPTSIPVSPPTADLPLIVTTEADTQSPEQIPVMTALTVASQSAESPEIAQVESPPKIQEPEEAQPELVTKPVPLSSQAGESPLAETPAVPSPTEPMETAPPTQESVEAETETPEPEGPSETTQHSPTQTTEPTEAVTSPVAPIAREPEAPPAVQQSSPEPTSPPVPTLPPPATETNHPVDSPEIAAPSSPKEQEVPVRDEAVRQEAEEEAPPDEAREEEMEVEEPSCAETQKTEEAEESEEVSETKAEEPSIAQPTEPQEEQTDTTTTEVDSLQETPSEVDTKPSIPEPTELQELTDTATVDMKAETAQEQQPVEKVESSNPPAIIITEVGSPRSPISPTPSGGRVTRSSEARRRGADSQEIRAPVGLQAQQEPSPGVSSDQARSPRGEQQEEEEEEEEETPLRSKKTIRTPFRKQWTTRSRKRKADAVIEEGHSVESTDLESEEEPIPSQPSTAVPSPAPSQSSEVDLETHMSQKQWRKAIMLVWRHAAQHKYANLFLHPVKEDDAPGYREVVFRPMDLSSIKRKIESGVIRTDVEFQRDVLLMFQNAFMYNSSDHDVFHMAEEMRVDVMESIQDYLATQLQLMVESSGPKVLRSREGGRRAEQHEDMFSPAKKRRTRADD